MYFNYVIMYISDAVLAFHNDTSNDPGLNAVAMTDGLTRP